MEMDQTKKLTLSRRDFARRAALLSATATLVPAGAGLAGGAANAASVPDQPDNLPKLSPAGQAEAESRYQMLLARYGSRLSDEEKASAKMGCYFQQTGLEHVRAYPLQNGDSPALYLKPLMERSKKPAPASPNSTAAPKKS